MTAPIPSGALANDFAFFAFVFPPNYGTPDMNTPGWSAFTNIGESSGTATLSIHTKRLVAGDLGTSVSASTPSPYPCNWAAQVVTVSGLNSVAPYSATIGTAPIPSPTNFIHANIIGPAGTATYVYTVTSIDATGEIPPSGTTFTVTNSPDTLTSTNYVQIVWSPILRATNFNIYGRTASAPKLIGTVTNQTTGTAGPASENEPGFNDIGAALGVPVPPTQRPLGWLVDGLNLDPAPTPLPLPERLRAPYPGAWLLMFSAAALNTPNTGITVTDPVGVTAITTNTGPSGGLVLHSAAQVLGAAGNVGTRLFTPSHRADAWVSSAVVLRPTTANSTPTARAGFPQDAQSGAVVWLDGSDSVDEDGDILTYSWAQTSGPTVALTNPTSAFPCFVMPGAAVTFRLTVTDPGGLQSTDTATIGFING